MSDCQSALHVPRSTACDMTAQGIALGFGPEYWQALKGRPMLTRQIVPPFQGLSEVCVLTQGVALGCLVLPRWGYPNDARRLGLRWRAKRSAAFDDAAISRRRC